MCVRGKRPEMMGTDRFFTLEKKKTAGEKNYFAALYVNRNNIYLHTQYICGQYKLRRARDESFL